MATIDIVIRYNEALGDEDAALALARRLFARLDEAIDSLALTPVAEEDFTVHLNGELVHSQRQSGRPPLAADVMARLREAP
jgi:predicted Rdx family selenoprotein